MVNQGILILVVLFIVELFGKVLDSFPRVRVPSLLQLPLYSSYIQTIGSCIFVTEPSIYSFPPRKD